MGSNQEWPATTGRATLSVPEAAEILGIGRNAAYDAAKRGEIPTIKLGKLIRVPRAALEALLDGRKSAA